MQHIRNAVAQYSTSSELRQVRQYSLVQPDSDFQTIIDASPAYRVIICAVTASW